MTDTKASILARVMELDAQDRSFRPTTDSERTICAQLAADGCLIDNGPTLWVVTLKGKRAAAETTNAAAPQQNHPTHLAQLWLANDYGLYRASIRLAKDALHRAMRACEDGDLAFDGVDDAGTIRKLAIEDLASLLENELYGEDMEALSGMGKDLLVWAAGQIDWTEIATDMLADVRIIAYEEPADPRDPEGDKCTFYRAEGL